VAIYDLGFDASGYERGDQATVLLWLAIVIGLADSAASNHAGQYINMQLGNIRSSAESCVRHASSPWSACESSRESSVRHAADGTYNSMVSLSFRSPEQRLRLGRHNVTPAL
jgi:hypothetical protein